MKHIINGRSDGVNFLPEFRYRWSHAMRQMADKRVTVTVVSYTSANAPHYRTPTIGRCWYVEYTANWWPTVGISQKIRYTMT